MSNLIKPHGGALVEAVLHGARAEALLARAPGLTSIVLDTKGVADLELVASGGATPLRGFMGQADYRSVLDRQRLATGAAFPLPLILPVPVQRLGAFPYGAEVALRDATGELRGAVVIRDTFVRDRSHEARLLHGTDDSSHPAVAEHLSSPAGAVGGEVVLIRSPGRHFETAREVRMRLAQHGHFRVAVAHGISPADAILAASPHADALVVASLAGIGSIPAGFSVIVATLPIPEAGSHRSVTPRELLLRALVLRNFGVTHVVLGTTRLDLATAHALAKVREQLGIVFLEGSRAADRAIAA